jgi:hypothetical protein
MHDAGSVRFRETGADALHEVQRFGRVERPFAQPLVQTSPVVGRRHDDGSIFNDLGPEQSRQTRVEHAPETLLQIGRR